MVLDRTEDFLSLCIRCRVLRLQQDEQQQQQRQEVQEKKTCDSSNSTPTTDTAATAVSSVSLLASAAHIYDAALPSPPFSFAPAAIAAAVAATTRTTSTGTTTSSSTGSSSCSREGDGSLQSVPYGALGAGLVSAPDAASSPPTADKKKTTVRCERSADSMRSSPGADGVMLVECDNFPVAAGAFAFLLLAARCAEAQQSIKKQLNASSFESENIRGRRDEGGRQRGHQRGEISAAAAAAAEEVSRLLQRVRQEQRQLQQLEQQATVWSGVEDLLKARQKWRHKHRETEKSCEVLPRAATSAARYSFLWGWGAPSKGETAAQRESDRSEIQRGQSGEALAHRHAVVGCLYASLQALTEELKRKEVAILQAQVEKDRYFSVYGLLNPFATLGDTHGISATTKKVVGKDMTNRQQQQQPSAAWMRMQSSLAAAAAARAAEHVLATAQSRDKKDRRKTSLLCQTPPTAAIAAAATLEGSPSTLRRKEENSEKTSSYDASNLMASVGQGQQQSDGGRKLGVAAGQQETERGDRGSETPIVNEAAGRTGNRSTFSPSMANSAPATKGGRWPFSGMFERRDGGAGKQYALEEYIASTEEAEGSSSGGGEGSSHQAKQLLLFEEQEQQLVASFAQETDVVLDVQRKLQEIVQCMDIFSSKVLEQSAACDYIQELADVSVEHITAAEKNLQLSLERSAAYRYYLFLFFIGAGLFLLLLDFLKSSSPYLF